MPKAVCCDDHQHCCPNGYTCDTKDGRCNKGDVSLPFFTKIAAIKNDIKTVHRISKRSTPVNDKALCPGGDVICSDDFTCCSLPSGQQGCCLLPDAICCSDQLHCCPQGYSCDNEQGSCVNNANSTVIKFSKIQSEVNSNSKDINEKHEKHSDSVVCPDGLLFFIF